MAAREFALGSGPKTEVPQPRFRWQTRVLLPVVLVVAAIVIFLSAAWHSIFPGRPVRVVRVMVKTVEATAGATTVTASGWLEPDPYVHYASALTDGVVEEVLVLEGQRVMKGDALARLVAEDAEIALALANAELAVAQADVARADADRSAAEEILATLIDRRQAVEAALGQEAEIEASLGKLAETIVAEEARLTAMQDERDRKGPLVASGAVSAGEYRRLSLSADAQEKKLMATRQGRPVLEGQLRRVRADLSAAREHIERTIEERHAVQLAKAGKDRASAALHRATAVRDTAQLRLDRMVVRAAIDGVVLKRLVSPGSRIHIGGEAQSAHIVHLYDPQKLQVRVDVPLADAAAIGADQLAVVEVQVLPDQKFPGRVTRLVHEADIQKNTVEVKVALDAPSPVLKPEMLARVRFLAGASRVESRQRVFAPVGQLRLDGGRAQVWVVAEREGDRGIAERRVVVVGGVELDGWREVSEGLQPGDAIIIDPPADLSESESVTFSEEDTP